MKRPWVREHNRQTWHYAQNGDGDSHEPMICGLVISGSPYVSQTGPLNESRCIECRRILNHSASKTQAYQENV